MKEILLKLIVCPYCKQRLKLNRFLIREKEVIEGLLICKCKKWYPVINGIPRLLSDELKFYTLVNYHKKFLTRYSLKLPEISKQKLLSYETNYKIKTADAFEYEWKHWPDTKKYHLNQFIHWMEPFLPSYFKRKLVLDAGCGTGNHVGYMADWRASIIGVDVGESINVAYYKGTLFKKNAYIIQADIDFLPFKEKTFDFIYSQGVLHHLPNPERGFNNLVKYSKNNGKILTRIYNKEDNFFMINFIEKGLKKIVKPLPFFIIDTFAFSLALIWYPTIHLLYVPLNKIFKNLMKRLPYNTYFLYVKNLSFYQIHCIVFDLLAAPIAYYYSKNELIKWYKDAGLRIISIKGKGEGAWRISGEIVK